MTPNLRNALSVALALILGATAPLALAQQTPTSPATPATTAPASVPDPNAAADVLDAANADVPDAMAAPADAQAAPAPMRRADVPNPAPADPSLLPVFKQFGELPGLTALMDDFMVQLLADPRMRPFFENAKQDQIKAHLVEQFCVILGGPCTYTGRDMKTTHSGLEIDRSQFNALVEDLQVAMNKRGVPFRAQNKLLAKLAPMYRQIEEK